jgi:hypothetical protein
MGSRQRFQSHAISKYEAMVLFTGLTMSANERPWKVVEGSCEDGERLSVSLVIS